LKIIISNLQVENLSDDEILKVNIPTGVPLVYELDEELKVLSKGYLGDQKRINKAMDSVKNQGKVNNKK